MRNKHEPSTFYGIHDPKHQDKLVHDGKYLISDEWGNVIVATYRAHIDAFTSTTSNPNADVTFNWVMDEGEYICEPSMKVAYGNGAFVCDKKNIMYSSRIEKFMPIAINEYGIKA